MAEPILAVCETCGYPHEGADCTNPACPSTMNAEQLEAWQARRDQAAAEQRDREFRQRMFAVSLGVRS
jgi:hypothetical protein